MIEKILFLAVKTIWILALIGSALYFFTFVFMLLAEVSGFYVIVVLVTAFFCLLANINILKRMF